MLVESRQMHRYIVTVFILSLTCLLFVSIGQAAAADGARNLYIGCTGSDVSQLQNELNLKRYYCGQADQVFGPRTQQAVSALQKENRCTIDGVVGPQTRQALAAYQPRLLYQGCLGADVARLQQRLTEAGYSCGPVDGKFGPSTYQAVVSFQKSNNCTADGIVGPKTRAVLAMYNTGSPSPPPPSRGSGNGPGRYVKVMDMVATGYCPCALCCGPYANGLTYTGLPAKKGIAAVDPNVIRLGTRLYVEGYGDALAADEGNAIKGNRIDLCFNSHNEALQWGMQNVKVYILPD